ncbi:methyltransferase domain-containing protein [Ruicaihuangia caeni]
MVASSSGSGGRDRAQTSARTRRFAPIRSEKLAHRHPELREHMDDPECDREVLRRTYLGFRIVNPIVSGWRSNWRRYLRPRLDPAREITVLDVGSGGGDIARLISRLARADGMPVAITAVDPDPRALDFARARPTPTGLTFRQASTRELLDAGERFDIVISNHVLHHLDAPREFLDETLALARRLVLHSDIERSAWAYRAFGALTWPWFAGSFIRDDGLTSIRKSFTLPELARVAGPGWRLRRAVPGRLLLMREVSGGHPDAEPDGARVGAAQASAEQASAQQAMTDQTDQAATANAVVGRER